MHKQQFLQKEHNRKKGIGKLKKRRNKQTNPTLEKLIEYLYVLIGSGIVAVSFNVFLLPNRVASGGVSGISTILDSILGWEPAFVQWGFNIPLFIAGVVLLGRHYGYKTLVGTIFLPFVVFRSEERRVGKECRSLWSRCL